MGARKGWKTDDDSELMEKAGKPFLLIEGSLRNIKLTYPSDFDLLPHSKGAPEGFRVGLGVDAHRFCEGDHVMLGGVAVPHKQGLRGHSDADPVLHALTDALLGALGKGDIGTHFPSHDAQWKDAPSSLFVEKAIAFLKAKKGRVLNVDITIIAEAPNIAPHREKIARSIAQCLHTKPENVSVKGTTTDGMGLTGQKEGIAAEALLSLDLPLQRGKERP